mgnify:CR=1 FL=1
MFLHFQQLLSHLISFFISYLSMTKRNKTKAPTKRRSLSFAPFARFYKPLSQKIIPMSLLYLIIVGAVAGWLAGQIMKGSGYGLIGNIIIGIVGSVAGSYLLGYLNVSIASGTLGDIITGVIGAVVILFIAGLFKK